MYEEKFTKEDILEALHIIQDVCEMNHCNDKCPFSDRYGQCLINHCDPSGWYITNPDRPQKWCAFENI